VPFVAAALLGWSDVSRVAHAPSRSDAGGALDAAGRPWMISAAEGRTLATAGDRLWSCAPAVRRVSGALITRECYSASRDLRAGDGNRTRPLVVGREQSPALDPVARPSDPWPV